VTATDPIVYLVVPCVLMLTALLAAAIPAPRTSQVDPMRALRVE
jgi:ABC-type lipoprotein release transport system permease subunit